MLDPTTGLTPKEQMLVTLLDYMATLSASIEATLSAWEGRIVIAGSQETELDRKLRELSSDYDTFVIAVEALAATVPTPSTSSDKKEVT